MTPTVVRPDDDGEPAPEADGPGQIGGTPASTHGDVAGARRKRRARSRNRAILEWVVAIGLAIAAAFLIKTYVVQAFVIPSGSMEHTLEINDRVLVSKFAYRISDIKRGDVIVFKNPKPLPGEPAQLIKRVAATEGDVIEAVDGRVQVNGQFVDEPYLAPDTVTLRPAAPDGSGRRGVRARGQPLELQGQPVHRTHRGRHRGRQGVLPHLAVESPRRPVARASIVASEQVGRGLDPVALSAAPRSARRAARYWEPVSK